MKKKMKKKGKLKDNIDYPDKIDMGGVYYVREDRVPEMIAEMPQEVRENFLKRKKKGKWWKPWSWNVFGREEEFGRDGNFLFLLDNEGNMKIYENVPTGIFKIKEFEGTDRETEKFLVLKPNKLRTITFEKEDKKTGKEKEYYLKGWVADINNPVALPEDPKYDCEEVGTIVRKAVSGTADFYDAKKKGAWNWLKWVTIGLVAIYVIYLGITKYHIGDWFDFGSAKNIASNVIGSGNPGVNGSVPGGSLT